ncbi:DNA internalization-related competence protein ComEC/Rec2 [Gallibacterium genomosp. 1]|uniref:Competence protein n=1 Tax=Gallibacterium genomosp. 1 TaxID=155515 RepID=A0AB36DX62_9PAST|nr:DNA internalization-related competence protein ComEC/Rec2 [Gallibacterium genomosp. 1]OBX00204.1 competence protein [Gallibacterium genomosp. 1]OBX02003.1 competence protein [Gallibacterium genomosp. 1]
MERIAIACIVSCLVMMYLPFEWIFLTKFWGIFFAITSSLTVLLIRKKSQWSNVIIAIIFSCCWCLFLIQQLITQAQYLHTLPKKQRAEILIEKVLHQRDYQTAIASLKFSHKDEKYRFYLSWQTPQQIAAGQSWQGEVTLKPLASRVNFGGFQRQKWLYANHIVGYAVIKKAVFIADNPDLRERLLRHNLDLWQQQPQSELFLALGFGDKRLLNKEMLQLFQQTGTAHLIAISGLHIGLVMLLGVALARCVQYLLPTHRITPFFPLLFGGICALLYSYLADFSIPTVRAIIALIFLLWLRFFRGHLNWWQCYVRCITIFVLLDPFILLSDSFWLSALAVLCLLIWNHLFPLSIWSIRGKKPHQFGKIVYYIFTLIHLQIGLSLLFTPITIFFFSGFNFFNLWINLWIVPIFSFVLIPLILFSILTFNYFHSWTLCQFIAQQCVEGLKIFKIGWHPISEVENLWISLVFLGLCLIWGMFCIHYAKYQRTKADEHHWLPAPTLLRLDVSALVDRTDFQTILKIIGMILGIMLWQLGFYYYQQYRTLWTLEMLDVGQGMSILIQQNGKGVLYDTAASWRGGSMAELEIIPYLQRRGIVLETIILSHDDNDHSGGAETLLNYYPNATLITSSKKTYAERIPLPCYKGIQWYWQDLNWQVIAPYKIEKTAKNHQSCVILLNDGEHNVLLTGDLDKTAELLYLADFPMIDILQVAHHGSRTSTSTAFLQKTQPKIALISAGIGNQWHFPHQEIISRLQQFQVDTLVTATVGQILLRFTKHGEIEVETARTFLQPWFKQLL